MPHAKLSRRIITCDVLLVRVVGPEVSILKQDSGSFPYISFFSLNSTDQNHLSFISLYHWLFVFSHFVFVHIFNHTLAICNFQSRWAGLIWTNNKGANLLRINVVVNICYFSPVFFTILGFSEQTLRQKNGPLKLLLTFFMHDVLLVGYHYCNV